MALLKPAELAILKVRLFDFKQALTVYIQNVEGQVFKGLALTPNLSAIKSQFDQAKANLTFSIAKLDGVIAGRTLDGQLVTGEAVNDLIQKISGDLRLLTETVQAWNAASPLGQIAAYLGKLGDATIGAFNALADFGLSLSSSASAIAKWLPWVILGAIALPPLIRIILAGRRGGTSAALEETAGQIETGRRKAGEAAGKAAKGAVTAAKFLI